VIPEALERYVGLDSLIKISEFFAKQLILSIKGKTDRSRKDRSERKVNPTKLFIYHTKT
jgi:hypothetical protein